MHNPDKLPPFIPENFAQIDFTLTRRSWKSIITDVRTVTDYEFDSDHFGLIAEVKIKVRNRQEDKAKWARYNKPEDNKEYSTKFIEHLTEAHEQWKLFEKEGAQYIEEVAEHIQESINKAAAETLPQKEEEQEKYESSETVKKLLEDRIAARRRQDTQEIKRLTTAIKHRFKAEKTLYRVRKLEEETWKIVKREKAGL